MPAKPTSIPKWATDSSVVEPSAGKKGLGWLSGEVLAAQMLNWWKRTVYQWVLWLAGASRTVPWYSAVAIAGTAGNYRGIALLDAYIGGSGNGDVRAMAIVTVSAVTYVRRSINAGLTWVDVTLAGAVAASTFALGGIAANQQRFVIVGANGRIQTQDASANANDWIERTAAAGFTGQFHQVIWTGTLFVAVGADFEVQTSPDGITWTRRSNAAPTGGPNTVNHLRRIAHAGGRLVRVGTGTSPSSAATGEIWTSDDDGATWQWAYSATQVLDKVIGTVFRDGSQGFAASGTNTFRLQRAVGTTMWDPAGASQATCAYDDMLVLGDGRRVIAGLDASEIYDMPHSGYSNGGVSIQDAAVSSKYGFALIVRLAAGGSPHELARTLVQRTF